MGHLKFTLLISSLAAVLQGCAGGYVTREGRMLGLAWGGAQIETCMIAKDTYYNTSDILKQVDAYDCRSIRGGAISTNLKDAWTYLVDAAKEYFSTFYSMLPGMPGAGAVK